MSRPAADQHPSLLSWHDSPARALHLGTGTPTARVYTCTTTAPPAAAAHITAAPPPFPSEHEQAFHELNLTIALVLNAPQAGRSLARLVNSDQVHPEGALVFASLLHITDRPEGAQFWWQFAAGGGNATAAYLLHLHHLSLGETRDAAHWRGQTEQLATKSRAAPHTGRTVTPLLPDDVRLDILARCHEGLSPRLPAALEAVINRLTVDCDDEDFGEIPQPSPIITGQLAR
ncbi:hypothetical protein [Kitasatospora brasiliensis]|uniref:hypothetical protein n=1 Tax=Kitasatospora brasiliensis TaxID=3058040 RepID=UPI00292D7C0D|nr:hypothetical protein [Kitasatospora sp. K002]